MPCAVRLLPRCALQSYFVNYPPSSTRVHGLLKRQPLSLFPLSFTGRLKPARESKRSSGSGNGADSRDHPAINNHLCRAINDGSTSGARERDRNGIENLRGRCEENRSDTSEDAFTRPRSSRFPTEPSSSLIDREVRAMTEQGKGHAERRLQSRGNRSARYNSTTMTNARRVA